MAKRKKKSSGGDQVAPGMAMPREKRVNVRVQEAENGYIVHTSCEGIGKNGYESKDHVAPNHRAAMQIANTHIARLGKKVRGKKSAKKKVAVAKS